jgi:hypothetical protein
VRRLAAPDPIEQDEDLAVRHTEFWTRMNAALGEAYARAWAHEHVMSRLGGRTVEEALAAGESPKDVWLAVWATLELPLSQR